MGAWSSRQAALGAFAVVYLAVLAQFSLLLRGAGKRTLAAVVLLATASSAAVFSIGDAIYGVIGQAVQMPGPDPGSLRRSTSSTSSPALVLANVISVALAGHRGVFPRWTVG